MHMVFQQKFPESSLEFPQVSPEFPRVSPSFPEIPRVSPSFPEFFRDSPSFPEIPRDSRFPQDSAKIPRVSPRFFGKSAESLSKLPFSNIGKVFVLFDTNPPQIATWFFKDNLCTNSFRFRPETKTRQTLDANICFLMIGLFPKMHAMHTNPLRNMLHEVGTTVTLLGGGWSDVSQSCCHANIVHTALFHEQQHCQAKVSRSRPDSQT